METTMVKYSEKASKSDLYARVKLAPVNAIERAVAVNALRDADAISDAIMWMVAAVRRLFTRSSSDARLLHDH
jgi:hypothetical protein